MAQDKKASGSTKKTQSAQPPKGAGQAGGAPKESRKK